jgi:alkylated DNA repair dioxygenase AlkB
MKKPHHKGINYTCPKHKPMSNKMNYVEHLDWIDNKIKRGHKQYQCPQCGKWLFRCEF